MNYEVDQRTMSYKTLQLFQMYCLGRIHKNQYNYLSSADNNCRLLITQRRGSAAGCIAAASDSDIQTDRQNDRQRHTYIPQCMSDEV